MLTDVSPGLFNYWAVIVLMMTGLYVVMAKPNLVKKVLGLMLFQVSVIMLYITLGKVRGGTVPILIDDAPDAVYSNPLPHVLMLTAIVVGLATTALALALVVRIHEEYGTLEEDEIRDIENEVGQREDEASA
ncbi:MAG: cation:proton antiporter subunit C [Acidobacteriota bacterium]